MNSRMTRTAVALLATLFAIGLQACGSNNAANQAEICDNGIDDDGDGFIDLDDLDCTETGDECDNGIDDDGDGFIDLDDPDCT